MIIEITIAAIILSAFALWKFFAKSSKKDSMAIFDDIGPLEQFQHENPYENHDHDFDHGHNLDHGNDNELSAVNRNIQALQKMTRFPDVEERLFNAANEDTELMENLTILVKLDEPKSEEELDASIQKNMGIIQSEAARIDAEQDHFVNPKNGR